VFNFKSNIIMKKKVLTQLMACLLVMLVCYTQMFSQDASTYLTPPKQLADLVNATPTPSVSLNSVGTLMLILERSDLPTIAELSQPELKLAGLRINPATNGGSRQTYVTQIKIKKLSDLSEVAVAGLPNDPKLGSLTWSPDETQAAFTHTSDNKIELYVLDIANAKARKLSNLALNGTMGSPITWFSDSKNLLIKTISANRGNPPAESRVPTGPNIQENLGKKAQAPTYQDLLKNESDARLFEYYTTSQLMKIDLSGKTEPIGTEGIKSSMSTSPDGKYILTESIERPFSYLVTYRSFATRIELLSNEGKMLKELAYNPLNDNAPWSPDATTPYPRGYSWRADVPSTICWTQAQDGGDPKKKVDIRDKVFALKAPFTDEPTVIYASQTRFRGITWGNETVALADEYWWQNRKSVTKVINPSDPSAPSVLFDQSSENRYNDPGNPEMKRNQYGRFVLDLNKNNEVMYFGEGASNEGDRPFIDIRNLTTKTTKRLWRSEAPAFERPIGVLNAEKGLVITTREKPDENPNYYIRNLNKSAELKQITAFPHPNPHVKGITKQLLRYKRDDGVELTATLYLPAGYSKEQGPLPTFLWAYPAEYKDKSNAGQVSGSPYQFNRISYQGAPCMATMGYAVLDNASIPIVGEGDKEPNDTYIEQLVSSAKAAILEGVRLGVVDSSRVGVGGHSYGAFMTANLLTHSNLFKAGIARSGAYNRTLTPFGFQAEPRNYWQAQDIYTKMSPFTYADKMKTPLLLIHGEADNNTGTYPIQSERYYSALKGMGATVRYITLPYESHGYQAKESLLHMLMEMNTWMDKYVKKVKKMP
jgi:dipeptidyl aminopeptidase/acylaminoacyl peptidase